MNKDFVVKQVMAKFIMRKLTNEYIFFGLGFRFKPNKLFYGKKNLCINFLYLK